MGLGPIVVFGIGAVLFFQFHLKETEGLLWAPILYLGTIPAAVVLLVIGAIFGAFSYNKK